MNTIDMIQAMREAGVPDAQILDAVILAEENRLSKQRARTAKCRLKKKTGNVCNVTSRYKRYKEEGVFPLPPSSPPTPPPISPTLFPQEEIAYASSADPPTKVNGTDPDFEKMWKAWKPYKTSKGSKQAARTEWKRHVRGRVNPEIVIAAVPEYCDECQRTDTNTQHVERWIKKHRWEDELMPKGDGDGSEAHETRDEQIARLTRELREDSASYDQPDMEDHRGNDDPVLSAVPRDDGG